MFFYSFLRKSFCHHSFFSFCFTSIIRCWWWEWERKTKNVSIKFLWWIIVMRGSWEQWISCTAHPCDFFLQNDVFFYLSWWKIKERKKDFRSFLRWLALKESKFDMGSFNVYRTHFNSLVKRQKPFVKSSRKIIFVLDKSCGKFFHRIYTRTTFLSPLKNRFRLRKNRFLFQQFTSQSKENIFVFCYSLELGTY